MMNCIALDDEPLALDLLQAFCSGLDFLTLQKTFTRPSEAAQYLSQFPVDLIFLDIQMPNISGIEFYKSMPGQTMVIFTTAFRDYAVEGFNLRAVDYLLKPYDRDRFLQAVERACAQYRQQHPEMPVAPQPQYLHVRSEYSLVRIAHDDILYIETLDDYLKIHVRSQKAVMTIMTMKAIAGKLPADQFVRVHKSYLVSLRYVNSVRGKTIELDGISIPIGQKYEEDFLALYAANGGG